MERVSEGVGVCRAASLGMGSVQHQCAEVARHGRPTGHPLGSTRPGASFRYLTGVGKFQFFDLVST